jgi:hypothetical protein
MMMMILPPPPLLTHHALPVRDGFEPSRREEGRARRGTGWSPLGLQSPHRLLSAPLDFPVEQPLRLPPPRPLKIRLDLQEVDRAQP